MKNNKSVQLAKTANSNCRLAKVDCMKRQVEFQNSNQKNEALNTEIDQGWQIGRSHRSPSVTWLIAPDFALDLQDT